MVVQADEYAPSFLKKPKLQQEDDGNKLIFECQLVGSPRPDVEWYRGDELVVQSKRIKVTIVPAAKGSFDVCLIVDDVEESDAGLYKVKAKNKFGEVAASINLNFSREYSRILHAHFAHEMYKFSILNYSALDNSGLQKSA